MPPMPSPTSYASNGTTPTPTSSPSSTMARIPINPTESSQPNLQVNGFSSPIKFECSIGYFAGTYEGYWKIYEPYARFGQDDDNEFERLGFAGRISGSKKKVIEKLSWAYSKIRSQGKAITRMAQQLG